MKDVIFSFETEDFTSSEEADAIYRKKKQNTRPAVLLAKQFLCRGRDDVI